MYRLLLLLLALLLGATAFGQVVTGFVLQDENKQPIARVSVVNSQTGMVTISRSDGYFAIQAAPGQTLVFTHVSFESSAIIVSTDLRQPLQIALIPNEFKLQKVIISGKTKYQQDSAARHEMFGHELTKILVPKPKFVGLGCAGCFGWLADNITGNSKKHKQFRKSFASDDELMYIDSRYNEQVVTLLTGISNPDSVAAFMYRYPMDYRFARAATDLEIKAWIRYNFKDYRDTTRR